MPRAEALIDLPQIDPNPGFIARVEARKELVVLPGGLNLQSELYTSHGLVAAVGHFGQRFTRAEVNDRVLAIGGKLSENTGFDQIYRFQGVDEIDSERPEEEYGRFLKKIYPDMVEVGGHLTKMALDARGWRPEEIRFVDFVSTMGMPGMARNIADRLGMVNAEANGYIDACAGSVIAIGERTRNAASYGQKGVLLAIDPVGIMPFDPKLADSLSGQVFSNGIGVIPYRPVVEIKRLAGLRELHEDVKMVGERETHALSVRLPSALVFEGNDRSIALIRNKDGGRDQIIRIPVPEDGKWIDMRGIATASFFIENGARVIVKGLERFKKLQPDREIDFIIAHHPSLQVYRGLRNRIAGLMLEQGYDAQSIIKLLSKIKWDVHDGNSSGSTWPIAFGRNLEQFKPGDTVLAIGYGAGGIFDAELFEIGQGEGKVAA